ncbi:MAG: hypothetical protein KUA43_07340 [Hoeflea sp.]|uniref:hypothetical protein n=1 Tax=Hoeflea sp. TaxID=1940281 RepID=UPI001D7C1DC1|nr:hypothetical protein [Hoeflea sp.]MBU4529319.1 hypothetical protein [Alphaproteobacteria bacterium]MBU4545486.1 hypothetical protein [Alphaproteobacteria bacterium]MBU4550201.1 hypothetical protein [Alphaproteobacteria bacterium]MBV1723242.1 hypothetical protein [Hoeflea sp.]MBV1782915.1 hypothetical protein [Hoeflea sp.]
MIVAILMVQSAPVANATTCAADKTAAFSIVVAQPANAESEITHVRAHMQIDDEKQGDQLGSMVGDCITLSCYFVVEDRLRSVSPLFIFGLSSYLNLNLLPSKTNAVMVHERPPRTI